MKIQRDKCLALLFAGILTPTLNAQTAPRPVSQMAPQSPPRTATQMKAILSEPVLRQESTAPPEIASKLTALRAGITASKATFTVGYTPALSIPLSSLAGLKVPADVNDSLVQSVNARAAKLESFDVASASAAHVVIPGPPASCKATAASFDWRKLNSNFPPVRAQCCGDCWDHAANEAFDDSWAIRNNQSIETSVQYALNCFSAGTCAGGWYMPVFDKIMSQGTATEASFPTTCVSGSCPNIPHPYRAVAWGFVNSSANTPSPAQIKADLCAHGPMATAVEADSAFQGYTGGVFDEHTTSMSGINHAITIIGWDDTKVGTGWGETGGFGTSKGYMWISYNTNNIGSHTAWVDAAKTAYVLNPNWINFLKLDTRLTVEPITVVKP
jgi:cathepsin L